MKKPKITLEALLKRRKSTIQQFISELGLNTYALMEAWCAKIGVEPLSKDQYDSIVTPVPFNDVTVASEGIVVVQAKPSSNSSDVGVDRVPEALDEKDDEGISRRRKRRAEKAESD